MLGNTLGQCPYNCNFCGVKTSNKVTLGEAIDKFDKLFLKCRKEFCEPYHPVIYNQGNVTNSEEFPQQLLDYILDNFNKEEQVLYVSLNSREKYATSELLNHLANKCLSYPIHFIFGVESFSKRTSSILGKHTSEELNKFIEKLQKFNEKFKRSGKKRDYVFGLDVNLLFLPELYLDEGETRGENFDRIRDGLEKDLLQLLKLVKPSVPVEINIHPYYHVDTLPYDDSELNELMRILPRLQNLIIQHNSIPGNYQTHLFIGVEGKGYLSNNQESQIQKGRPYIDDFNQTGMIGELWKNEFPLDQD